MARLFVAVEMPPEIIACAQQLQAKLREQNLFKGPYAKPESMHVTLKFLGDVAQEDMSRVICLLNEIKAQRFLVSVGSVDTFKSHERIKVIYLHLISQELEKLAAFVDQKLAPLFEQEVQPWKAHLTLARVKAVDDRAALEHFLNQLRVPSLKTNITSFKLIESIKGAHGFSYVTLAEFLLA